MKFPGRPMRTNGQRVAHIGKGQGMGGGNE